MYFIFIHNLDNNICWTFFSAGYLCILLFIHSSFFSTSLCLKWLTRIGYIIWLFCFIYESRLCCAIEGSAIISETGWGIYLIRPVGLAPSLGLISLIQYPGGVMEIFGK